jgi:hypothetical protein
MNLSAEEFLSLSNQLSDRDVKTAELELQLQQTKQLLAIKEAENVALTQQLSELQQAHEAIELENTYLKRYLWLSWSKIKSFMAHIHDIRLVAFLQTFMLKTVSENMGSRALETINDAVSLPDEEEKPSTHIQADQVILQNHGTVNGPKPRDTATKTDKQVKQAVELLMDTSDEHQLPQNVELWHQYLNTADEYSHKQVAVAVRLMELLSKVKP